MSSQHTLDPKVTIGHVHLTVSNLQRSLDFYCGVLGFEVTTWYGDSAVFISAGGYHHHIGLNTWQGTGIPPQPPRYAGLYHFAILFPTRKDLARALYRLQAARYPLTGTADHGVSEAIYLQDPDGIGVELYVDRPRTEWPRKPDGSLEMFTQPLDTESLLAELDT